MQGNERPDPVKVRSVFLSDLHLGTRECRAERILDFLHSVDMEQLYLVGDVIDLWALRSGIYWPQSHNNVLRTILGKAKQGTRVFYVPGNHDSLLREFCGHSFGNVEFHREIVHVTARGLRMLVLHGDEFDGAVKCSRWSSFLGTHLYDVSLRIGYHLNRVRQAMGFRHWSLVTWLKGRVGNVLRYVAEFERAAAHTVRRRGLDGVICGHIHRPEVQTLDGVLYCNDGDWVEHCTALVEDRSGELELWDWSEPRRVVERLHHRRDLQAAA
jgi:UDP-2,3-diacylglucosamine pyrophosphatase LpxH